MPVISTKVRCRNRYGDYQGGIRCICLLHLLFVSSEQSSYHPGENVLEFSVAVPGGSSNPNSTHFAILLHTGCDCIPISYRTALAFRSLGWLTSSASSKRLISQFLSPNQAICRATLGAHQSDQSTHGHHGPVLSIIKGTCRALGCWRDVDRGFGVSSIVAPLRRRVVLHSPQE